MLATAPGKPQRAAAHSAHQAGSQLQAARKGFPVSPAPPPLPLDSERQAKPLSLRPPAKPNAKHARPETGSGGPRAG